MVLPAGTFNVMEAAPTVVALVESSSLLVSLEVRVTARPPVGAGGDGVDLAQDQRTVRRRDRESGGVVVRRSRVAGGSACETDLCQSPRTGWKVV